MHLQDVAMVLIGLYQQGIDDASVDSVADGLELLDLADGNIDEIIEDPAEGSADSVIERAQV